MEYLQTVYMDFWGWRNVFPNPKYQKKKKKMGRGREEGGIWDFFVCWILLKLLPFKSK